MHSILLQILLHILVGKVTNFWPFITYDARTTWRMCLHQGDGVLICELLWDLFYISMHCVGSCWLGKCLFIRSSVSFHRCCTQNASISGLYCKHTCGACKVDNALDSSHEYKNIHNWLQAMWMYCVARQKYLTSGRRLCACYQSSLHTCWHMICIFIRNGFLMCHVDCWVSLMPWCSSAG